MLYRSNSSELSKDDARHTVYMITLSFRKIFDFEQNIYSLRVS